MKHSKKLYWSITGLATAFMLMAAVPDLLMMPLAVAVFMHLGYPTYLLPFLGIAKILGAVAVLLPGSPRLKEWAYAGLVFDLVGALYSHLKVGDPASVWLFPVIGLLLVIGSYRSFRYQLQHESGTIRNVLVPTHATRAAGSFSTR